MKKNVRKALRAVLLMVFVVSTALMVHQWLDNAGGEVAYNDAMDIAMQVKEPEAPAQSQPTEIPVEATEPVTYWVPVPVEGDPVMEEMAEINIAALREENEDVLGWIRIPDTRIDYPLLQGEDNDFYLKHTWQKQRNSVGSIFLEHLNRPDLTDFNTIVYGHNMRDKSMFGQLDNYSIEGFWETHPYVYIAIDSGVYRYEVFAFLQAPVDSVTYSIRPQRDDTKQEFIDYSMEHTWIDTGVRPVITDRILTLSTCTGRDYSARNVVQARLPMMEVTE